VGRLHTTPGGTARGAVRVRNLTDRAVTVLLQPADIRNSTNGNADYITTRPSQAGRWVRLASDSVRLAPGAARRVAYAVHVPRGTTGTSHYAGIVAVDAREIAAAGRPRRRKPGASGAGFTISRINRQALPLTIRLPGPLTRKLTLRAVRLDVRPTGAGLILGLLPRGTVLMQGAHVKLRVSRFGRTVMRADAVLGQLFPDSRLDYRIAWSGRPTKGTYRVQGVVRPVGAPTVLVDQRIAFTPKQARSLTRQAPAAVVQPGRTAAPVWMVPALVGAGALLLLLLLVIQRLLRRRPGDPAPDRR
jgi:hypothetical protein